MAGDKDSRRSTTGYVFTIGGTIVSWISNCKSLLQFQKQKHSMLFLRRLVNKWFGYRGLWRNWERSKRITGYIVTVRVPFILQRTQPSIQRLSVYSLGTISYDPFWKRDI
jgi:hypothetical protein